jgi:hypothetical protein
MYDEHEVRRGALWGHSDDRPTARQRTAVQNAVTRVFDALAPERAPARAAGPAGGVLRYRSPRGCVLQGNAGAVSVSWFPATGSDAQLGELQVIAWDGVVSLPGAARRANGGARARAEVLFRPLERAPDAWSWRTADGAVLDADAVVAHCLDLLGHDDASTAPVPGVALPAALPPAAPPPSAALS